MLKTFLATISVVVILLMIVIITPTTDTDETRLYTLHESYINSLYVAGEGEDSLEGEDGVNSGEDPNKPTKPTKDADLDNMVAKTVEDEINIEILRVTKKYSDLVVSFPMSGANKAMAFLAIPNIETTSGKTGLYSSIRMSPEVYKDMGPDAFIKYSTKDTLGLGVYPGGPTYIGPYQEDANYPLQDNLVDKETLFKPPDRQNLYDATNMIATATEIPWKAHSNLKDPLPVRDDGHAIAILSSSMNSGQGFLYEGKNFDIAGAGYISYEFQMEWTELVSREKYINLIDNYLDAHPDITKYDTSLDPLTVTIMKDAYSVAIKENPDFFSTSRYGTKYDTTSPFRGNNPLGGKDLDYVSTTSEKVVHPVKVLISYRIMQRSYASLEK